ncbi:hypothetical protein Mlute_02746 [Meiothermus luteus]|uniref:Uncharacterized protein n=2 Tax=Meiothermus luteus TaxID=2026184 RepID=A0A399EBB6_9DEIN|nr:hypothetical protein Mlute_02746 [Meiothermus luteus]
MVDSNYMADSGLERAFAKVRALLEGDFEHPGLTLYDLQNLVGYNSRVKTDGPLSYTLPPEPELSGVAAVRLYYYPKDPEVTLIVEIEDKARKRHLRHFKWNGISWTAPHGLKSDLTATREVLPAIEEVGGDFFLGYAPEEAKELAEAIRRGEAAGTKYMLCTRDNTRIFYSPTSSPPTIPCPRCGNGNLIFKTLTLANPEDRIEALLREQRALRTALEDLLLYLKRKLGP